MTKIPDLSIIILNYNTSFWLKKMLESLDRFYLKQTAFDIEVIVVDNNSKDNSVQMLKSNFPWVTIIENTINSGYASGNNIALRKIKSKYAMLLNSDVELTVESNLDVLVDYLNNNPQVAVVTPAVRLINGKLDPACHRGEPTLWTSFSYFSGLEKTFPKIKQFAEYHQTYKDLSQIHTIAACSGAAMIIRTSVLKKVGYLDERFFMYAEDLDLCKRIRDFGKSIVFHPQVTIIHHKYKSGLNSSMSKIATKTSDHFYDTMLQYYDKHYHNRYPKFVQLAIKKIINLKKGSQ